MHALTVQYYEVVQVYETETRLQDAERCIFLPMRPIDFSDERNILRYLPILQDAALDGATRNMLAELAEQTASGFALTFPRDRLPFFLLSPLIPIPLNGLYGPVLQANARALARDGFIVFSGNVNNFTVDYRLQLDAVRWPAVRPGEPIPTPITGVSVALEDGTVIELGQSAADNADPGDVDPVLNNGSPLSFGRIARISLKIDAGYVPRLQPQDHFIRLELAVRLGSEARWLDCGFLIESSAAELAAQSGQDLAGYALTVIVSHVNAVAEAAAADRGGDLLAEAVARMAGRTPEQIAAARERAFGFIRPGKPLAAGQTIFDAVVGKWPGDETDEDVAEALRRNMNTTMITSDSTRLMR